MNKWMKEVCLLAVFGLMLTSLSAYALTCKTVGIDGRTSYCSVTCVCSDGTVLYACSDCSALDKVCRWSIAATAEGKYLLGTYCANDLPI